MYSYTNHVRSPTWIHFVLYNYEPNIMNLVDSTQSCCNEERVRFLAHPVYSCSRQIIGRGWGRPRGLLLGRRLEYCESIMSWVLHGTLHSSIIPHIPCSITRHSSACHPRDPTRGWHRRKYVGQQGICWRNAPVQTCPSFHIFPHCSMAGKTQFLGKFFMLLCLRFFRL